MNRATLKSHFYVLVTMTVGSMIGMAGVALLRKLRQAILNELEEQHENEVAPKKNSRYFDDTEIIDCKDMVPVGSEPDMMNSSLNNMKISYYKLVALLEKEDTKIEELQTEMSILDRELTMRKSVTALLNRRMTDEENEIYDRSNEENANFFARTRQSGYEFFDFYLPVLDLRWFVKSKIALGQDNWEPVVYPHIYQDEDEDEEKNWCPDRKMQ